MKLLANLSAVLLVLTLSLGASGAALAVEPDEMLPDPVLEARALEVSKELRCVVCQNQTIDGSNAPLARDMRLLVRERILAGDTDAAAKAYLVARYGDFVLLRPPFQPDTWALWLGPILILVLAGAGLLAAARTGVSDEGLAGQDMAGEYLAGEDGTGGGTDVATAKSNQDNRDK